MTAFACIQCGESVTAVNALALRLMMQGAKQPMCANCRQGVTVQKSWKNYEAYLASPEWKALAAQRKKIDGYKCRLCFSPERLEVHHRTYDRQYHEDIEDLTTLCHECHEWYELWKKSRENGRQLVSFTPVTFEL